MSNITLNNGATPPAAMTYVSWVELTAAAGGPSVWFASGGATVGGAAAVTQAVHPTGGVGISGGATDPKWACVDGMHGGVLVGGSAEVMFSSTMTSAGGAKIGGTASVGYSNPIFIPDGGVAVGGSSTLSYMLTSAFVPTPEDPYNEAFNAWAVGYPLGAVSRYNGMPANSCCVFKGKLFVANRGGVYAVDSDTDRGLPIHASVTLGMMDFDSPQNKNIPEVYVAAETAGQLSLAARTIDGGEYEYTLDPTPTGIHGLRALLGRGAKGRYWQLRVDNVAGAAFTLDAVSAAVVSLQRKEI
jgi:hypothetical protein